MGVAFRVLREAAYSEGQCLRHLHLRAVQVSGIWLLEAAKNTLFGESSRRTGRWRLEAATSKANAFEVAYSRQYTGMICDLLPPLRFGSATRRSQYAKKRRANVVV